MTRAPTPDTARFLAAVVAITLAVSAPLAAQVRDTVPRPPSRIRVRIGQDTLPLQLPTVQTRSDELRYREAEAEIQAARATAFQLNSRSILESVWGQVAAQNFATGRPQPLAAQDAQLRKPRAPTRDRLFGDYADLGIQLDSRLEFRNEKDQTNRCQGVTYFLAANTCRSAFEPTLDFQYALRSAGVVAERVHVNVDYDSQREFDASNTISIAFEGKPREFLQRLEVGNVTFQPPPSRFITAAIPSGNYGVQAVANLGEGITLRSIVAQQKGNVVRDRVFTVGDRVLQAVDRSVEDYQFEPRRFFFTVDPRQFAGYPNVDILNRQQMTRLAASLPDTLRPVRLYVYRLLIGGQPPNPDGPQFRLLGDPRSKTGQVYEYLREGVDYYADPSRLWIALVRPLSLNNERLVVAYRVRINGVETTFASTGGTPDLQFTTAHAQFANLLWDPNIQPADAAFRREIRSVYRLGGSDVVRQSVSVKVVTGNATDQEKPLAGAAATYLELFGLAQPTNTSTFDVENRLWPRATDPDFALGVGAFGTSTIRDQFLVFPSLRPFASNGLAGTANPHNDTVYTTPADYLVTSQRPGAVYHIRLRYQAQGNGTNGTLSLGAVQVRPNSERILVDNVLLARGSDYSVDYDLGRVNFARPDTLFPRPRQVTVQFEENPLFVETPTSIIGSSLEIPLSNGQINILALSQSQKTSYTRPLLGLEPQSTLIGGINAVMNFDAEPLTRLVSRLPYGHTDVPSHVTLAGEFAASKPQPSAGQQAYLESFEEAGGLDVLLGDQYWYYSSQPAVAHNALARFGSNALDLNRATQLAYQTNVRDSLGKQLQFTIDKIDPEVAFSGAGVAAPEQLLWLTMFPLSVGLRDDPNSNAHWSTGSTVSGRRWRSIRTSLSFAGTDVSRTENIEFWALVDTSSAGRARNPTLVLDIGEISENSVALQPDTVRIHGLNRLLRDTLMVGRRLAGFDRLDSERDPFSRTFNANVNDRGLPGDVADSVTVIADTLPGQVPVVRMRDSLQICRNQYGALYALGDTRTDCTVGNGRLDEEDLDGDNVLNLTSAQREQEQIRRFVVDLSDDHKYNRVGKCIPRPARRGEMVAGPPVCWVFVRVPFRAPDDTLNAPLLRRARALRITMISGSALPDSAYSQIALDRLRLSGAPWLKRSDAAVRGIAGDQPSVGFVSVGTVGTEDRGLSSGINYDSPPGVANQPDLKSTPLTSARVLINEHSLRVVGGGLNEYDRAEAYYRFPEGQKNFLGYKEMRLWARGVSTGWGINGELEFYVKLGHDATNFYMYHTPLSGAGTGNGPTAWLPEIRVDFSKLIALRAQVQNAYLRGTRRNTCSGADSVLVANTPFQPTTSTSALYAACSNGYIVYTTDPGVNPPNLAAIQELAVGMLRVPGTSVAQQISPSDTLELWVDDIRLGGVVDAAGFAGQVALGVTASDFADVRVNLTRRDPNFRQLGDQPTYLTDNTMDVSAAFRMEKLLPRSFGYSIPVTLNYTGASSDPTFLTQSDIDASAVTGLRTPHNAATSVTFGVRRATPVTGGTLAPLLNNLTLQGTFTSADARSEYEDGHAHDLRVGLEYNLIRAIAPSLATVLPTEVSLSTTYENGNDRRVTYIKPAAASDDSGRVVSGLTNTVRNGGALAFHPLRNSTIRFNLSSLRDLRSYSGIPDLGLVDASERDRLAGFDTGLERERNVGTQISYSVAILPWLKSRFNSSSSYSMLRDPNTLDFIRAVDSISPYRIPRKIGNTQNANLGFTIDFRTLSNSTNWIPGARALLGALQPLDISLDRNVLTAYDGAAASAPLVYQLGLGDISQFRHIGADNATSAGVNDQLTLSQTINLPFGATLTNHLQRLSMRNWTLLSDNSQDVGDAQQLVFPDIALRWSRRATDSTSVIQNFTASARVAETSQLLIGSGEYDVPGSGSGLTRIRSYPVSVSAVWLGSHPLSTSFGANLVQRLDDRPGLNGRGTALDVNADIARAFALPPQWHPHGDLRTRVSFQDSYGQSYVLNPLVLLGRSRLTDNGRRSATFTADTDVSDTMTSSFVISRVESFDRNLSREFTQTVLSAILHLQFYSGEMH
ncbi:MAG: cell surface protein SprA [Gemmatimonadota bacterium]|nr:cell surface protein SprA [Gemmatimonadota bacterium]